jgi:hypothetical protein
MHLPRTALAALPAIAFLVLLVMIPGPVRAGEVSVLPPATGLWVGQVMYAPGMVEIDFTVEIATATDGHLVGTIDIPSQQMKLHLLEKVEQDGDALNFEFDRFPDREDVEALFYFKGVLAATGEVTGTFNGITEQGPVEAPFRMQRLGDAGTERPVPVYSELHDLAADLGNLKAAFNAGKGKVRVLNLISPTCGVCRISATIIQRYVLEKVDSDQLEVFNVWGPMLGDETREAAVDATSTMPDGRALHYWTEAPRIAQDFRPVTGLGEEELAWDTFLIYPTNATWGDTVPAPAVVLHVNKPLPEENRLHGDRIRQEIEKLLPAQ